MKIFFLVALLYSCAILINCASGDTKTEDDLAKSKEVDSKLKRFYPSGEKSKIVNEKNELVEITELDSEFFQKPSKEPRELFRVIVKSDSYQVRQLRKTDLILRKPDPGGDSLMMDELKKYDLIDYKDDGVVIFRISPYTGKTESVNFHYRSPRIADLAKFIQADATRWIFIHKQDLKKMQEQEAKAKAKEKEQKEKQNTDKTKKTKTNPEEIDDSDPSVTSFLVTYQIEMQRKTDRDGVKKVLEKEVRPKKKN